MTTVKHNVLIAGIGGASLGTELCKSLALAGRYNIFGADISPHSYGLYQREFQETFVVSEERYIMDLLAICKRKQIHALIPGAEKPLSLITPHLDLFWKEGIVFAMNSQEVIDLCTDKAKNFEFLGNQGVPIPWSVHIKAREDIKKMTYPCIVKPSRGSGGSQFVFIAESEDEAMLYVAYMEKQGVDIIAQEYIIDDEGEYTVAVLSLPDGEIVGSVALQRLFHSKISYALKTKDRIISTGISQGRIDEFREVRKQAEHIARIMKSKGPLNVQGRMRNGVFYPFEINPRYSATNYIRAMAGFNEVDMLLNYLLSGHRPVMPSVTYGYYLRTLDQTKIEFQQVKRYDQMDYR